MKAFERIAYITLVAGVVGDQISTRLALTNPCNYETNGVAVMLMQTGLWLPLDALLVLASIAIPTIILRRWSFNGRWAVLVFPFLLGLCRLAAAIWNIHLFLEENDRSRRRP